MPRLRGLCPGVTPATTAAGPLELTSFSSQKPHVMHSRPGFKVVVHGISGQGMAREAGRWLPPEHFQRRRRRPGPRPRVDGVHRGPESVSKAGPRLCRRRRAGGSGHQAVWATTSLAAAVVAGSALPAPDAAAAWPQLPVQAARATQSWPMKFCVCGGGWGGSEKEAWRGS